MITKPIQRARKTSVTAFRKISSQNSESGRKLSAIKHQMDCGHDNNNFVIDVNESGEGISEIERNMKLRMQKRDDLMR